MFSSIFNALFHGNGNWCFSVGIFKWKLLKIHQNHLIKWLVTWPYLFINYQVVKTTGVTYVVLSSPQMVHWQDTRLLTCQTNAIGVCSVQRPSNQHSQPNDTLKHMRMRQVCTIIPWGCFEELSWILFKGHLNHLKCNKYLALFLLQTFFYV